MRAIDTNVLVRLITRDDERQVETAEEFVSKGAWVSHLVLAETSWVLDSVYDRTPEQIAKAIGMLLDHKQLTIQDQDAVEAALEKFRKNKGISFSDLFDSRNCPQERTPPFGKLRSGAGEARRYSAPVSRSYHKAVWAGHSGFMIKDSPAVIWRQLGGFCETRISGSS